MKKVCTKCKKSLDISNFRKQRSSKDGLQCYCNDCVYLYQREYKKSDSYKKKQVEYRRDNRDKLNEYCRKYQERFRKTSRGKDYKLNYQRSEKYKDWRRKYVKHRLRNDIQFMLKKRLRNRLWDALRGNAKNRISPAGSHLHLDISKDKLILSNYKNFIDPDKYNWIIENMYNVKSVLRNEIEKITKDDYGKIMNEKEQTRAAGQLKKFRKECESMQPLVDEDAIVSEIEQLQRDKAELEKKLDGQSSKIQNIKDYIKKLFI